MSRPSMKGRLGNLFKSSFTNAAPAQPEETEWLVGGRYQVTAPLALHSKPDLTSERVDRQLRPKDTVLLLAMKSVQSQASSGEVLLACVANTRNPHDWVMGWGLIEGEAGVPPALRKRRLPGSWERGGRYVVDGAPVLRSRIELESEQVREITRQEEVLVLDLGLVIRSKEPRLRAKVRVDSGEIGWLTIELPGGHPLLEPLNLYSAEALHRKAGHFGERHRKSGLSHRVTLDGNVERSDEAWEIGGKYRLVSDRSLGTESDPGSRIIGELRKGSLVTVVDRVSEMGTLRLKITNERNDAGGWISPLSPNGEKLLDSRDHLEFEKVLRHIQAQPAVDWTREVETPQVQDRAHEEAEEIDPEPWIPSAPYAEVDPISHPPPLMLEEDQPSPLEMVSPVSAVPYDSYSGEASTQHSTAESPNISLIAAHAKTAEAEAIHRDRRDDKSHLPTTNVARPWNHGTMSGFQAFHDKETASDDKHVSDSLENEGLDDCCYCRPNGMLNCSAQRVWAVTSKVAKGAPCSTPAYPYPNGGYQVEPAPEPRPLRPHWESPPVSHATSHTTFPNN